MTSSQLNNYKLMTLYLPLLLLVAGVVVLGVGIAPIFVKRGQNTESVMPSKVMAA